MGNKRRDENRTSTPRAGRPRPPAMTPAARAAVGEAFLAVMRARHPDYHWRLVPPEELEPER